MASTLLREPCSGGFSFENCHRNKLLSDKGVVLPKARKTGTTIVGAVFDGGVILGADTRATEGNIVADKNCSKIHYIADNIYCCGAGTAADTEMTTRMISSQLQLHRLNMGPERTPRVISSLRMLKQMLFRYQGYIGAALVLGGVDCKGPHLHTVAPHGSTDTLPYVAMGSGSLAAMSVLETRYKTGLSKEECIQLVRDAIAAGIFNDLGSGSNVDICIITKDGVDYKRPYDVANKKGERAGKYTFDVGTTKTLNRHVKKVEYEIVSTRIIRDVQSDTMDTS